MPSSTNVQHPARITWSDAQVREGLPAFTETVALYTRFYVTTSLVFDLFRALGNAALVLVLGGPALRVLERYRARFSWQPWTEEG